MELSPEAIYNLNAKLRPSSLDSSQTVTCGRTAIKLIAQILKDSSKESVLLPAYLCQSMIQPFREAGIRVDFFGINADLTIDTRDLERMVSDFQPGAVLFINYFGFPVNPIDAACLRRVKQECWIIEDCAQGSLIEFEQPVVGDIGDFVLTSFRKYLPIPDGGVLINRTEIATPALPPADGPFIRHRLIAKFLRYEFLNGGFGQPSLEEAYLDLFANAEGDLDSEVPLQGMSVVSEKLMAGIDLQRVMEQRRSNFRYLLSAFESSPQLQSIGEPMLGELSEGVSPLVFPIQMSVKSRDPLRQALIARKVFCPVHWPTPTELMKKPFPQAHQLSNQMLGLTIDQRYDETDMESMTIRMLQAWEETK